MAESPERDESEVTVDLETARPYYPTGVEESNDNVVWVGPGEVRIPAWVAKEWKVEPKGGASAAVPKRK